MRKCNKRFTRSLKKASVSISTKPAVLQCCVCAPCLKGDFERVYCDPHSDPSPSPDVLSGLSGETPQRLLRDTVKDTSGKAKEAASVLAAATAPQKPQQFVWQGSTRSAAKVDHVEDGLLTLPVGASTSLFSLSRSLYWISGPEPLYETSASHTSSTLCCLSCKYRVSRPLI